jgi:hypothetical protein
VLAFLSPFSEADACTEFVGIPVALRRNGMRPGKLQVRLKAVGTGRPRPRDTDRLRFVCLL